MDSPVVDNQTDFVVHPQMILDRTGEQLVAVVKATFEVEPGGIVELASPARTRRVRFADLPWEEDKPESIAYPADVFLRKGGTDVIVVARACAPGGRPVPQFDARVQVGTLERSLVVFGQRVWTDRGQSLTAPAPIAEIEVRYDYAWGGRDDEDQEQILEEARNPIGRGVVKNAAALTHQPAPNLEDPGYPIRSARTAPPPTGFGVVGRSWEPRRRFAGTYDKAWKESRAPLLPDDFDDRFNECASPGLHAATPLQGGEEIRLLNLTRGGGAFAFAIPRVLLELEFRVKDRPPVMALPHLDTVLVDTLGADRPVLVEMVWRASVKSPRRLRDAKIVVREREAA